MDEIALTNPVVVTLNNLILTSLTDRFSNITKYLNIYTLFDKFLVESGLNMVPTYSARGFILSDATGRFISSSPANII